MAKVMVDNLILRPSLDFMRHVTNEVLAVLARVKLQSALPE
jgi:hypothetical protein